MSPSRHRLHMKHCSTKIKSTSDSSIYSTCTNSTSDSSNSKKEDLRISTQSVVLAGQAPNTQISEITLEESFFNNQTNYSISPLDLNLDVLDEDDVFMDCRDASKSDSNGDDSTKYLPLEAIPKQINSIANNFSNNHSNYNKSKENIETQHAGLNTSATTKESEHDKLLTIIEETEVTRASSSNIARNVSLTNDQDNTGNLIVELVDKINKCNKITPKRVLFAEDSYDIEDNEQDKYKSKARQQTPKPRVGKNKDISCKRSIDEKSNNNNTTESFIMWEKYCESPEKLNSRKSCSLSELNTSLSYKGGNECSTNYETLDDEYVSIYSLDTVTENEHYSRKPSLRRSKSCDSLLKEVKHLPHMLYDKFLEFLATEIEKIRKQKVYCDCQENVRKSPNKENIGKRLNNLPKPTVKVANKGNNKKENKLSLQNESNALTKLSPEVMKNASHSQNRTRLSPDILKDSRSYNTQRLNQKSPRKTSTTPSKKLGVYWHKEIVSPVGEYINMTKLCPEVIENASLSQSRTRLSPDILKDSHSYNTQLLSPKSPNKTSTIPSKKHGVCWHKEIISPVGEYIRGKRPSPYKSSPSKRRV